MKENDLKQFNNTLINILTNDTFYSLQEFLI